jgi:hypothetical protein
MFLRGSGARIGESITGSLLADKHRRPRAGSRCGFLHLLRQVHFLLFGEQNSYISLENLGINHTSVTHRDTSLTINENRKRHFAQVV